MAGQLTGEQHGRSKLTEKDVIKIRRAMNRGASHVDLAEDYPQVDPVTIFRAGTGRTWVYLGEPPSPARLPRLAPKRKRKRKKKR
ncbi:MAG: hypothetical protein QF689_16440 [Candidatus Latescibacteria bacterium]|jgi:hypothetical protein|nr:hypothetical protein [Gemmatimonadaceae bacterium]MDP6018880.1 hypothetical protein [Candidatus Latescibacterota bacterium]MDP7450182.1 hypothetical protein [Candidatus Latescibacterota bacterium]HJP32111.1 hypothetical protein [Candidatus Latescibacterota bacterium]